jgi:hypothetical protein
LFFSIEVTPAKSQSQIYLKYQEGGFDRQMNAMSSIKKFTVTEGDFSHFLPQKHNSPRTLIIYKRGMGHYIIDEVNLRGTVTGE